MRTETLWQGERRAARMHWWLEVVDRPTATDRENMFDEVLSLRFRFGPDADLAGLGRRRAVEAVGRSRREARAGLAG